MSILPARVVNQDSLSVWLARRTGHIIQVVNKANLTGGLGRIMVFGLKGFCYSEMTRPSFNRDISNLERCEMFVF